MSVRRSGEQMPTFSLSVAKDYWQVVVGFQADRVGYEVLSAAFGIGSAGVRVIGERFGLLVGATRPITWRHVAEPGHFEAPVPRPIPRRTSPSVGPAGTNVGRVDGAQSATCEPIVISVFTDVGHRYVKYVVVNQ